MLQAGSHLILADVIRVRTLESFHRCLSHLGIHITVFSVILPHSGPTWVASQIDYRCIRPGNTAGLGFIRRNLRTFPSQFPIERSPHVDSLREQGAIEGIRRTMNLVYAIDTRYADFFHGNFLYAFDHLRPSLFLLCYAQRHIQNRPDLIFAYYRIQLCLTECKAIFLGGLKISDDIHCNLTHLTDFFFQGHFFQPFLDIGFNGFVCRNGRLYAVYVVCHTHPSANH